MQEYNRLATIKASPTGTTVNVTSPTSRLTPIQAGNVSTVATALGFSSTLRERLRRYQDICRHELLYVGDQTFLDETKDLHLIRIDLSVLLSASSGDRRYLLVDIELKPEDGQDTDKFNQAVKIYALAPDYATVTSEDSLLSLGMKELNAAGGTTIGDVDISIEANLQKQLEQYFSSTNETPIQFAIPRANSSFATADQKNKLQQQQNRDWKQYKTNNNLFSNVGRSFINGTDTMTRSLWGNGWGRWEDPQPELEAVVPKIDYGHPGYTVAFGPQRHIVKRSWINPSRWFGDTYVVNYEFTPLNADSYVLLSVDNTKNIKKLKLVVHAFRRLDDLSGGIDWSWKKDYIGEFAVDLKGDCLPDLTQQKQEFHEDIRVFLNSFAQEVKELKETYCQSQSAYNAAAINLDSASSLKAAGDTFISSQIKQAQAKIKYDQSNSDNDKQAWEKAKAITDVAFITWQKAKADNAKDVAAEQHTPNSASVENEKNAAVSLNSGKAVQANKNTDVKMTSHTFIDATTAFSAIISDLPNRLKQWRTKLSGYAETIQEMNSNYWPCKDAGENILKQLEKILTTNSPMNQCPSNSVVQNASLPTLRTGGELSLPEDNCLNKLKDTINKSADATFNLLNDHLTPAEIDPSVTSTITIKTTKLPVTSGTIVTIDGIVMSDTVVLGRRLLQVTIPPIKSFQGGKSNREVDCVLSTSGFNGTEKFKLTIRQSEKGGDAASAILSITPTHGRIGEAVTIKTIDATQYPLSSVATVIFGSNTISSSSFLYQSADKIVVNAPSPGTDIAAAVGVTVQPQVGSFSGLKFTYDVPLAATSPASKSNSSN